MIEWFLTGAARLVFWLWTSAMTLYYLAGFFVVAGGLVIFIGSVIHHYWKHSAEARARPAVQEPRVTVHIENVILEVTEAQVRYLLTGGNSLHLPAGGTSDEESEQLTAWGLSAGSNEQDDPD